MATTYNFKIDQGSDFNLSITYADPTGNAISLLGFTARMDIRSSITAPSPLIRLTTENSRIVLGGANGTINIALTAAETDALPSTLAVYDLEIVAGNNVTRLIEGTVRITPQVTR